MRSQHFPQVLRRQACVLQFARFAKCCPWSNMPTMRRSARWQNDVTEVTVITTNCLISTVAATSSGRIAATAIVMTPTTNATRSGMTRLPLIAVTRRSSHAQCMGLRASTPLRSATRTQGTTNVNFKTRSAPMKHHNKARYTSNDDESRSSMDTPVPSEDPASASSKSKKDHKDENCHPHVSKKMKAGCHVPCKSDHQWQRSKFQLSQKGKKEKCLLLF